LSEWSDRANATNRSRIASRESTSVVLVFESGDQIVGVAHDDHIALGVLPSPAFGPEIEDVVQIDTGRA
jgi:hypothetical protein